MSILTHYNYWIFVALMMIGFYTVIARDNLVKKLIGLSIFQSAVFIFYISMGFMREATAPILAQGYERYSNPLTSVLILTAIVVGVATLALGLALVVRIREAYGTTDEGEIQRLDEADEDRHATLRHSTAEPPAP
jgi:multicomponent Na+:H+ antiporter subunit C